MRDHSDRSNRTVQVVDKHRRLDITCLHTIETQFIHGDAWCSMSHNRLLIGHIVWFSTHILSSLEERHAAISRVEFTCVIDRSVNLLAAPTTTTELCTKKTFSMDGRWWSSTHTAWFASHMFGGGEARDARILSPLIIGAIE